MECVGRGGLVYFYFSFFSFLVGLSFLSLLLAAESAFGLGSSGRVAFQESIFWVSCRTISGFSEARFFCSFQSFTRS